METKYYSDAAGNKFLEIISRQYSPLRELEAEHKKLNRQTWVNIYNSCEGSWMLTILMNKGAN